jgi:hypothetical protein
VNNCAGAAKSFGAVGLLRPLLDVDVRLFDFFLQRAARVLGGVYRMLGRLAYSGSGLAYGLAGLLHFRMGFLAVAARKR